MSKVYKLVIWGIFICAFLYAFFMYFYSSSGHEKINFGEVESVILYKDKYSSKVPDDNVSKVLDIIEKIMLEVGIEVMLSIMIRR